MVAGRPGSRPKPDAGVAWSGRLGQNRGENRPRRAIVISSPSWGVYDVADGGFGVRCGHVLWRCVTDVVDVVDHPRAPEVFELLSPAVPNEPFGVFSYEYVPALTDMRLEDHGVSQLPTLPVGQHVAMARLRKAPVRDNRERPLQKVNIVVAREHRLTQSRLVQCEHFCDRASPHRLPPPGLIPDGRLSDNARVDA